MARLIYTAVLGGAVLAATALAAAPRSVALAGVLPGLWETTGVPGAKTPRRECVRDVLVLAQYEHRGKSCARTMVSESGATAIIDYDCGGAGFGRSKVTTITPRSLRIETQGISANMPFNYLLQARRVGECEDTDLAARH